MSIIFANMIDFLKLVGLAFVVLVIWTCVAISWVINMSAVVLYALIVVFQQLFGGKTPVTHKGKRIGYIYRFKFYAFPEVHSG